MKLWQKIILAAFSVIILITLLQKMQEPAWINDPSLGPEQRAALTFYDNAWNRVKSSYLDPTLNHQNWDYWRTKYSKTIKTTADAYIAVQTMLASLNDPYTRLLIPKKAAQQNQDIEARIFGVGMQLAPHKKGVKVAAVIDNSPALKAGIKAQDIVTRVDNQSIANIDIEKVVDKIRGPKGTLVALTIQRGAQTKLFKVERDEIKIQSVFYKALPRKIAYIRLSTFMSEEASNELAQALDKAQKSSEGLILDIRENFGGLFSNAQYIADMFLANGRIVSVVDRQGGKQDFFADREQLYNKPMILLVDGGSASASEILSGALKENKRATLIGQTTFGKGLVQKIINLEGGAELNMTIAKYLTPLGHDIHKKGIVPDIETPLPPLTIATHSPIRDITLERAQTVLQKQIQAPENAAKKLKE